MYLVKCLKRILGGMTSDSHRFITRTSIEIVKSDKEHPVGTRQAILSLKNKGLRWIDHPTTIYGVIDGSHGSVAISGRGDKTEVKYILDYVGTGDQQIKAWVVIPYYNTMTIIFKDGTTMIVDCQYDIASPFEGISFGIEYVRVAMWSWDDNHPVRFEFGKHIIDINKKNILSHIILYREITLDHMELAFIWARGTPYNIPNKKYFLYLRFGDMKRTGRVSK